MEPVSSISSRALAQLLISILMQNYQPLLVERNEEGFFEPSFIPTLQGSEELKIILFYWLEQLLFHPIE